MKDSDMFGAVREITMRFPRRVVRTFWVILPSDEVPEYSLWPTTTGVISLTHVDLGVFNRLDNILCFVVFEDYGRLGLA